MKLIYSVTVVPRDTTVTYTTLNLFKTSGTVRNEYMHGCAHILRPEQEQGISLTLN